MKFKKFVPKIPFLKRKKVGEAELELEAGAEEAQEVQYSDEASSEQGEDSALQQGEEVSQDAAADSQAQASDRTKRSPEAKGSAQSAAEQPKEGQPEKKSGSKTDGLMDELLKEISSDETSPVHLLAKSLDDVDINYLLTEGRTVVARLRRVAGKRK